MLDCICLAVMKLGFIEYVILFNNAMAHFLPSLADY